MIVPDADAGPAATTEAHPESPATTRTTSPTRIHPLAFLTMFRHLPASDDLYPITGDLRARLSASHSATRDNAAMWGLWGSVNEIDYLSGHKLIQREMDALSAGMQSYAGGMRRWPVPSSPQVDDERAGPQWSVVVGRRR